MFSIALHAKIGLRVLIYNCLHNETSITLEACIAQYKGIPFLKEKIQYVTHGLNRACIMFCAVVGFNYSVNLFHVKQLTVVCFTRQHKK